MSKWRRLALELFPDERLEFQRNDTNIYHVFFTLLARLQEAYAEGRRDQIERIYQYADRCLKQENRASDIDNAAGVAFYEHLADEDSTYHAIPYRIKPALFERIMPLLWWRLHRENTQRYLDLLARYNEINGTAFQYQEYMWEKLDAA